MAREKAGHAWAFHARFRRGAFGWRSQPAISRVLEAVAEIKKVAKSDPRLAAEGANAKRVSADTDSSTISVHEVAGAMGIPVVDALAFLDEHGFARTVDKIKLDDDERARVLEAMRRDRIERKGLAPPNAHDVAVRTVIASQRIEDVDARRWLPPRS